MSPRRLTAEERELWARLKRSVRPLSRAGREELDHLFKAETEPGADREQESAAPAARAPAAQTAQPARTGPPPLIGLDPRERRRLARGGIDVDARFDLHGMSQDRAFTALLAFLRGAQARGHRTVLVITGKRRPEESARGVLRAAVPEWLARPDIRPLILGVEEAARRHGGSGALYVRLRRR